MNNNEQNIGTVVVYTSYYNKLNAHFDAQEYSFNFGRSVMKCGRNMERRRERNIAEPKFELKSLWSQPYLRDREKIGFCCSETPPSILNQSTPKLEEYITVTQGVT